jgi:hypothetical protein
MSYLKSKDGSIEASIKEMQKHIKDNAYQDMFKKELEKTGKGIGAMSDQEKKDFFNKIDKMHKAKSEDLNKDDEKVVKKVKDMLKGASDKHAAQAKMLDKAMKTEAETPAGPDVDQMNAKKAMNKDPKKGEKEPMKMNTESLERTIWKMAADELEEMKKNSKYMKAQDVAPDNDADSEKDEKKGKTLIGSKQTKVETEPPKVDYNK